jgi:serine/threonine protein kinase
MAIQKFEKLKIDTGSTVATPRSGLSAIAIHNDQTQTYNGALADNLKITSNDLLRTDQQPLEGELGDREDNDGVQERDYGGLGSSVGTMSEQSSLETPLHSRGTAISFDSQVTLEGGHRHSMEIPLPRSESFTDVDGQPLLSAYDRQQGQYRGHSDTETSQYDSDTGEPLDWRNDRPPLYYREGEMRHPLLQSTVDDLAKDPRLGEQERISFFASTLTESPIAEEALTPLNNYLTPFPTSPISFPARGSAEAWLSKRSDSHRSRSLRSANGSSLGSFPSNRRRDSSRRSATTSISPAGQFLAQWARPEDRPPEPDDEGQEIPDHSGYIIGRRIGFGGFSVVKEVFTMENEKKIVRAAKIVRRRLKDKDEQENERIQAQFEHEVSIWRFLKHRYVLPLLEVYVTDFATFCITPLNKGGTLFDLVRSRRKLVSSERGLDAYLSQRYIYQLGSAIRYLHEDARIVHRDIKLENCLLDLSDPRASIDGGNVLLCDFGIADFIHNENYNSPTSPLAPSDSPHLSNAQHTFLRNIGPSDTSTSVTGSLQYVAPEIVGGGTAVLSTAVDIWAYGVCMYTLITGDLPFQHSFQPKLLMMISKGEWDMKALMDSPAVKQDGARCANVVRGSLEPNPDVRYSIRQLLDEDWFVGCKERYEADEDGPDIWNS